MGLDSRLEWVFGRGKERREYRARQPEDRGMFLSSRGFPKESKVSGRHSLFFAPLLGQAVGLFPSEDSCLEYLHPSPASTP